MYGHSKMIGMVKDLNKINDVFYLNHDGYVYYITKDIGNGLKLNIRAHSEPDDPADHAECDRILFVSSSIPMIQECYDHEQVDYNTLNEMCNNVEGRVNDYLIKHPGLY